MSGGWPGILLHEAIGHGLEADFNRKKTSAFSNLVGKRVASEVCTIVDDGTLPYRRGSLNMDDEGTPTGRTVLIKHGILRGYITDKMNARLLGIPLTGNGRRESYQSVVLPRMTNTFMLAGESDPADIIRSVKRGLYAVTFGGGQVDITNGKFVFSASEAYLIEDGRVTRAGERGDVDRERAGDSDQSVDGRARSQTGRRHWDVRQGRAIGAGRSRAPYHSYRRNHRGRDAGMTTLIPTYDSFADLAQDMLARAKQRGASEADVIVANGETLSVQVRMDAVDRLTKAREKRLGLRVFFGKRSASASTSDFSKPALEQFVAEHVRWHKQSWKIPYPACLIRQR